MIIDDNSISIIKTIAGPYIKEVAAEEQIENTSLEWLSIYLWQQKSSYVNDIYKQYSDCNIITAFDSTFGSKFGERKLYRGMTIESEADNLSIDDIKVAILNGRKYSSFSNSCFVASNFMRRTHCNCNYYSILISTLSSRYIFVDEYRNLEEEEYVLDIDDIKDIKIEEMYYVRKII